MLSISMSSFRDSWKYSFSEALLMSLEMKGSFLKLNSLKNESSPRRAYRTLSGFSQLIAWISKVNATVKQVLLIVSNETEIVQSSFSVM